eukprot:CAMPEP_0198260324 /NCGR_PEP_ID=MMETSP1447-20131203/9324_1 /TAXON_ID=420782 /ORGANISM="Chaetoceros dichaeta, Strain CCMP1751" /LENGTH=848 /DNA_ID=CAMNT_0043947955 /DNA_START=87 /DNA_END=2633 /DNA_ORIENTATION=+
MSETKEIDEYTLSKTIITDGEPVRSVAYVVSTHSSSSSSDANEPSSQSASASESEFVISGTEGGVLSSTNATTFESNILSDTTKHGHHVTAVIGIPSTTDDDTMNGYVSGCKDSLVRIFDCNHTLVRTLTGHTKAVTSLSWVRISNQLLLLTGSWDGTAKLWNSTNGTCLATMDGHENTVSVQGLPPTTNEEGTVDAVGRFVTGSAGIAAGNVIRDHKIRLWNVVLSTDAQTATATITKTVANDHDGPIRGLAFDALTAMVFSCSNDGTVRVRDSTSGECVLTLHTAPLLQQQQPPMLLDVTSLGKGLIAACSEDGNAFIWNISNTNTNTNNDQHPQIIAHPNCVWKIEALPNGDLITACHDGFLRIFTQATDRHATPDDIATFHEAVQTTRAKTSSGPSPEEIAKLPNWTAQTSHTGKSDGQVQVFAKDNKAIAAQWSAASRTWIEVGEVTGRNDAQGTINGVRFDHVFPIEMDVAGGGVQTLTIGYNNGDNPFVTAQAFIDEHVLDQGYLSQIADYIRQRTGESSVPTLGTADGGNNTQSNAAAGSSSSSTPMDIDAATPSYQYLPMKGYKSFDAGADSKTLTKIITKIREFNATNTTDNNPTLSTNDIDLLDNLCATLGATSRYHSSSITDAELNVIHKIINSWSSSHAFPAIDLARLTVLHPDASKSTRGAYWSTILQATLQTCNQTTASSSVAIPMLSLRLCANCFRGGNGSLHAVVGSQLLPEILQCAANFSTSTNKNVRLAVSTVLLNAASYLQRTAGSCDGMDADSMLSPVGKVLASGLYETEATVRVLVALGTVLLADDKFLSRAKELDMAVVVRGVAGADQHGAKASVLAKDIQRILQ